MRHFRNASLVVCLIVGLGAAGCSSSSVWEKPGVSQQDFATDSYACEKDGAQNDYYGHGGLFNAKEFEKRCMIAHGWTEKTQ